MLKGASGNLQSSHSGVIYIQKEAAVIELGVVQHLFWGLNNPEYKTALVGTVEHIVFVLPDEVLVENPTQLLSVCQPRRRSSKPVVVQLRQV